MSLRRDFYAARVSAIWEAVTGFPNLIATREPAAVAQKLRAAGIRLIIQDRRPQRVELW